MNGVDRVDQQIQYYPFIRKSIKWHKKFTMYLFQLAMHNAFILFRFQNSHSKIDTMKSFILEVCQTWLNRRSTTAAAAGAAAPPPPLATPHVSSEHILQPIPRNQTVTYPKKRCRICVSSKIRRDTRYECSLCKMALCKGKCFTVHLR